MQDADDEFAECARRPCVHQISTLLLLRMESAPAMRLGAADWLPTLEKRARAGRGSRLKSTLFMGPRHKGFNSERQRRSQNCLLCAGKKKMQPQKVEFPLKDTEYFKSFTLHKALCMSDFQMLHLSSKQSHVWKRKEKVCLFFS